MTPAHKSGSAYTGRATRSVDGIRETAGGCHVRGAYGISQEKLDPQCKKRTRTILRFERRSAIRYKKIQEIPHQAYETKVSDALGLANSSVESLGVAD